VKCADCKKKERSVAQWRAKFDTLNDIYADGVLKRHELKVYAGELETILLAIKRRLKKSKGVLARELLELFDRKDLVGA